MMDMGGSSVACRMLDQPCAATADCCFPNICQANKCQRAPSGSCGDGVCALGENPTNCCFDCGCPQGYACSGSTKTCLGTTGRMNFTLRHLCGLNTIAYRFFDVTHAGVWPANLENAFIINAGETRAAPLACIPGAKVCYGARQANTLYYWGLDLDGSKTCPACCATCGLGDPPTINLVCP